MAPPIRTVRLILGDQLNIRHPWFAQVDDSVLYLMAELHQEARYVRHHWQKLLGFLLAMRQFADTLRAAGHRLHYVRIGDAASQLPLPEVLRQILTEHGAARFEYQQPDEYRLDQQLLLFSQSLPQPGEACDSAHFYTRRDELAACFPGDTPLLMERFYRRMRRTHGILLDGAAPLGGRWNFDHDNRKKYKGTPPVPPALSFARDVSALLAEITAAGVSGFGQIDATAFPWPANRDEALAQLAYFCQHLLSHFGEYQDALHSEQAFLFHSRLSFALNLKLISPAEVINAAVAQFQQQPAQISLAQIEGFVRQILGWREYVRGVYWKAMPEYSQLNQLDNHHPLPQMFWTGHTRMRCLHLALTQSLRHAYAHHIQRLMVIGNFALLSQRHPDAVDAWYLGVYIDAIEWVELPNTRGMSQYADGGLLASKPYVSSGSYINKMSNYCAGCAYQVKARIGHDACPFNSLYWRFLDDKKAHFAGNPRMAMMLKLLADLPADELSAIRARAGEIMADPDRF